MLMKALIHAERGTYRVINIGDFHPPNFSTQRDQLEIEVESDLSYDALDAIFKQSRQTLIDKMNGKLEEMEVAGIASFHLELKGQACTCDWEKKETCWKCTTEPCELAKLHNEGKRHSPIG
jgi:hypothetical protein